MTGSKSTWGGVGARRGCASASFFLALFACSAAIVGCGGAEIEPINTSLVEHFDLTLVSGTAAAVDVPDPVVWRFDGEGSVPEPEEKAETMGFEAFMGIEGLSVRDGRLIGRAGEMPILHVETPEDLRMDDLLYAIEIRMRVSGGTDVSVAFNGAEELNREAVVGQFMGLGGDLFSPLRPGDDFQTYTLTGENSRFAPSFRMASMRHILITLTEADGAEFEIESVRLISRKEHLASILSGIGWQGLGDIYRETIVTRSPERVDFEVAVPSNAWLDLTIGTIEDGPVTFRVSAGDEAILERTLTTPGRWEATPIDLSRHAGQRVRLFFSVQADQPGTLAYWGSPMLRSNGAMPQVTASSPARDALTSAEPPQGVILIIADTLRRDHLDPYGYERPTAPVLAQMAEEGVLFRETISQATWTKVSVPSILTSLYPRSHGVTDLPDRIASSIVTIEEAFREAGYATFHTSSVPFSGKLTNLHQGVDVLHERTSIGELGHSSSKTARTFVDRLLPWLETHRDVPFFVLLHVMDPHTPFEPYPPYDTTWADAAYKAVYEEQVDKAIEVMKDAFLKNQRLPDLWDLEEVGIDPGPFLEHEIDWYDGSILAMDVEVGRLLESLEQLGLAEDTLVAFISDHGEELLEHGRHWHGFTIYGDMLNVPLILWWQNVIPAGLVVDELVQSIDLMPTLLEFAGIPVPAEAQGQSLLPLLANPESPQSLGWMSRPAFSERVKLGRVSPMPHLDRTAYSIIVDGWKLVQNTDRPEDWPEYELYDHVNDPINLNDVSADHPEIVGRLAQQLSDWLEWALAHHISPADDVERLSPAELERLRSLGYIR